VGAHERSAIWCPATDEVCVRRVPDFHPPGSVRAAPCATSAAGPPQAGVVGGPRGTWCRNRRRAPSRRRDVDHCRSVAGAASGARSGV